MIYRTERHAISTEIGCSPLLTSLAYDFAPSGLGAVRRRQFTPTTPFHFEVSTDRTFSASVRFVGPSSVPFIPKQLSRYTLQASVFRTTLQGVGLLLALESPNGLFASVSMNPLLMGFRFYRRNFGGEFIYNSHEEQPSFSLLFNGKSPRGFEFSGMASMYGNILLLTSIPLKFGELWTHCEGNILNLDSEFGIGYGLRCKNLTGNVSFLLSSKTLRFDCSLTKGQCSVSGFWPLSFAKIK
jgi:hypothetical protein